jgi:hypothetical protein
MEPFREPAEAVFGVLEKLAGNGELVIQLSPPLPHASKYSVLCPKPGGRGPSVRRPAAPAGPEQG